MITLVIIGVISALVIPTIIQNAHERATITKVKKAFTVLNNATKFAVAQYGPVDTWGFGDTSQYGANSVIANNHIKPYIKTVKDCGNNPGCYNESVTKFLNKANWLNFNTDTGYAKMQFADGMFLGTQIWAPNCNNNRGSNSLNYVCGAFYVDIDGYKGKNTNGKDIFLFYITKNGQIIPAGTPEETYWTINTCKTTEWGGGCAAWVIYKENMDYLKGKTVQW